MTQWGRAGALLALALIGLAGCLPASLVPPANKPKPPPDEQVFSASLEWVALTTEGLLKKRDMQYVAEPDGEVLRIRATTPNDGKFSLYLSREAGSSRSAPLTRVRFAWESGTQEPVQVILFQTLDALAPQ
jgi:hypothetical protein